MNVSACLDVGGTKIQAAVINREGSIFFKTRESVDSRGGDYTCEQIRAIIEVLSNNCKKQNMKITGIGIAIPGQIINNGEVWAPNIPHWQRYPLKEKIYGFFSSTFGPIVIISDRRGFAEGEYWQGCARNTPNFIFIAIGTGIGAGIFINGAYYSGYKNLSGSIGWLTLKGNVNNKQYSMGNFERYASGEGIVNTAREILNNSPDYTGKLTNISEKTITARDIFKAYDEGDKAAQTIFSDVIEYWSIGIADCISILAPQLVVLGGGLFGPAEKFLRSIRYSVNKLLSPAQKDSAEIVTSSLGNDGVLLGIKRVLLNTL